MVGTDHQRIVAHRRVQRTERLDEAGAIKIAAWLWRSTKAWVQVAFKGRVVAWVKGDPDRGRTSVSFGQGQPYQNQDDAVAKLSAGKHLGPFFWWKPVNTGLTVDNWYDLWGCDGSPSKGAWGGTARTARTFIGSTAGGMWTGGAVSPSLKYLTRASHFSMESTIIASLLYDRVLAYDACTMSAGSQNMDNTVVATRYVTNGDPGLQIFIEADTVHNATAANLTTLTYVSNAGTGSRTVLTTPTLSVIPSIVAPTNVIGARGLIQMPGQATKNMGPYLNLQSGDQGVQSITDFQFSAAPTGTNSFVLQFPFCIFVDQVVTAQAVDYEFIYGIESVNKRIFDDACLSWMIYPRVQGASQFHGVLECGTT